MVNGIIPSGVEVETLQIKWCAADGETERRTLHSISAQDFHKQI